MLVDKEPLVFTIAILTVMGDLLLPTTIKDGNCSLAEMKTITSPYLPSTPETFEQCQKRMMEKIRQGVQGGRYCGRSLPEGKKRYPQNVRRRKDA